MRVVVDQRLQHRMEIQLQILPPPPFSIEDRNWQYKFDIQGPIETCKIQYSKEASGAETSWEVSDCFQKDYICSSNGLSVEQMTVGKNTEYHSQYSAKYNRNQLRVMSRIVGSWRCKEG